MVNISIRIPDQVHAELVAYKAKVKPHVSLNAIVVDSVMETLSKEKSSREGKS